MTVQRKVLSALVAAGKPLTSREVAKRAKVTLTQARDTCSRLARAKVIRRSHSDGSTRELRAFAADSGTILPEDRKTLRALVKAYGRDVVSAVVESAKGPGKAAGR